MSDGLAAAAFAEAAKALRAFTDLIGDSPTNGDIAMFDSALGRATLIRPPWTTATGPGGVAGGDSGTAVVMPDPLGPNGYGDFNVTLTDPCQFTLPAPATIGSKFDWTSYDPEGGNAVTWANSPAVAFPGVQFSQRLEPGAINVVQFKCRAFGGSSRWEGFPATSAMENLRDLLDPDEARHNLREQVLRSAIRMSSTNITLSGLQTIDGHVYTDGERHFCTGQTDSTKNGLWTVRSGAWTRPTDYPTGASFRSRMVAVDGTGTSYAHSLWMFISETPVVVGTNGTTWVRIDVGAAVAAPVTLNYFGFFGDGSDGAATLATGGTPLPAWATYSGSDVYALSRDAWLTDLTINAGVTLNRNGYRLFVNGTLTNNGTIGVPGNAAVADVAGAKTTTAGTVNGGFAGAAGGTGVGVAGTGGTVGNGGAGGAGGSGAGGSAASGFITTTRAKSILSPVTVGLSAVYQNGGTTVQPLGGGSGGSSGAGDGTNKGGGGGSGGPCNVIFAKKIVNNGVIQSIGGAGGNGVAGNTGGGGGGSGGTVLIWTLEAITGSGSISVAGGAGGAKSGTGVAGSAGGTGQAFTMVLA